MRSDDMIKIAYIVDHKYVMPTCISIISVKQNKKSDQFIKIYIVANKLLEEEKNIFQELEGEKFYIEIIDVPDNGYAELEKRGVASHVTSTALYKFDLPYLLKEEDKVLYLDGDILVQRSLEELYSWNVQDYWLAAADDMIIQWDNNVSKSGKRIGLETNHYFNSGVLLLNLEQMRGDHVSDLLICYKSKQINYFMDQDAFNYVCKDKRVILPAKFNYLITASNYYTREEISRKCFGDTNHSLKDCGDNAVILHLTGNMKPWEYQIPIYSEYFMEYYYQSIYRNKPLYLKSAVKYLIDKYSKSDKVWRFPYEKIPRGSKIVLYGAGEMGRDYYEQMKASRYCEIALWVDENYLKRGREVSSPKTIGNVIFDYILIAVSEDRFVNQILDSIHSDFPENNFHIIAAINA